MAGASIWTRRFTILTSIVLGLVAALASGAPPRSAIAQTPPASPELPVNTITIDDQGSPAVAMDAVGNFVVWESFRDDATHSDVYMRRYRADGTFRDGAEVKVKVNTSTGGEHFGPRVAMDSDGDFIVVWEGDGNDGYGVYARRFNANGIPRDAGEVTISTALSSGGPAVAVDADGDYVIAWDRTDAPATSRKSMPGGSTPRECPRAPNSTSILRRQTTSRIRWWRWTRPATSSSPGPACCRTATWAGCMPGVTTRPARPRAASSP